MGKEGLPEDFCKTRGKNASEYVTDQGQAVNQGLPATPTPTATGISPIVDVKDQAHWSANYSLLHQHDNNASTKSVFSYKKLTSQQQQKGEEHVHMQKQVFVSVSALPANISTSQETDQAYNQVFKPQHCDLSNNDFNLQRVLEAVEVGDVVNDECLSTQNN
jgi:hypothetical protein